MSYDASWEDRADGSSEASVDYVNATHPLRRIATRFSLKVRTEFFNRFISFAEPTAATRVLDVGVTPDESMADSNFFERWYPFPSQITASSVEDATILEERYPGLRFVQTSGMILPFADNEFDIVFSSAVIEHVGDRDHQRQFISELLRVAGRFFLTTPNRWFPLELHTFLPVAHWLPQHQHQWVLRHVGQEGWASTENLNLLDEATLRSLFPQQSRPRIEATRVAGLRSNLIASGTSPSAPTS
jgi:SAM-dependent methyltransferase